LYDFSSISINNLVKENKMKMTLFGLLVLLFALAGCSAKNVVTSEAKDVRIYDVLPANMDCKYIDEIYGSEANMFTFLFMSNYDMTAGARAHLRNQAAQLGGNSVEIQNADFMYTSSTVFIGHVYNCSK
jgi:hypothetical protein